MCQNLFKHVFKLLVSRLALAGLLRISHPVLTPIFADPATPEAVGSCLTCLPHLSISLSYVSCHVSALHIVPLDSQDLASH